MKTGHVLLITLFVLLTALADALIFRSLPVWNFSSLPQKFTDIRMLVAGLSFGQLGLLTAWFVFGRAPIWARLSALAGAVFLLGWFLADGWIARSFVEWLGFSALYVAGESAILLWLRLIGLRMVGGDEFDLADSSTTERRTWQFSLNGLLIAMTLVCLAAAVVRWIKPDDWPVVLLYCAALIPNTCLALWLVWSGRSPMLRIALAVPAIVVLTLIVGPVEGRGGIDWYLLLLSLVQSAYLIVGSLIARIGGLKLEWLPKP